MENLIPDLLLIVFRNLNLSDLVKIKAVSRSWYQLICLHYEDNGNSYFLLEDNVDKTTKISFFNDGKEIAKIITAVTSDRKKAHNSLDKLIKKYNQIAQSFPRHGYSTKTAYPNFGDHQEEYRFRQNRFTFKNYADHSWYQEELVVNTDRRLLLVFRVLCELKKKISK